MVRETRGQSVHLTQQGALRDFVSARLEAVGASVWVNGWGWLFDCCSSWETVREHVCMREVCN